MKVRITMTIDPEYADEDHPAGVNVAGYDAICDRLQDLGTDIDVAAESG